MKLFGKKNVEKEERLSQDLEREARQIESEAHIIEEEVKQLKEEVEKKRNEYHIIEKEARSLRVEAQKKSRSAKKLEREAEGIELSLIKQTKRFSLLNLFNPRINIYPFAFIWSILINLILETLGRKGEMFLGGIKFMVMHPLVFMLNTVVIFITFAAISLFRRRFFYCFIVTTLWMTIGGVNSLILSQRMTPFTVQDLSAITEGATLVTNYLSSFQIILIAAGVILAVSLIVFVLIKGPKMPGKIRYRKNLAATVGIIVIGMGLITFGIRAGIVSTFFGNLAYAYRDYGIAYSFASTWINTGIERPKGYSEENVKALFEKEDFVNGSTLPQKSDESKKHPNIIYLQLESFVDPYDFKNLKYSADPIPNFRKLMKEYSSGYLTVPACGAGTANTEFETLTGVSARFFGPGEYPYKAILSEKTMEAIPFVLEQMGYSSHAIHNHRAVFYNRHEVFKNLHFDDFTSLEYMSNISKTPKNWAKDRILIEPIMDALKATENRDFLHVISVQGHGKYPAEQIISNPKIQVTEYPSEEAKWKNEYFINQIYEMDQFVGNLTKTLEAYDEPVVLVMFGDHIPALDINEKDYAGKDLYQTPYVIWSNFKMDRQVADIKAYELTSHLFDQLNMSSGTIFKYQQRHKDKDDPKYIEGLKTIAYDMLYGKQYVYGQKEPFKPSNMKMGVKDIKIEQVVGAGGKFYIKGQNFTESSKITLNGETLNTVYLSPNLLALQEEVSPADVARMKVSQVDRNSKEIISTTE